MRTQQGTVTSAKMTGTVTVTTHRLVFHPIYKKRFRKSKKFLCDPNGMDLYPGDLVLIGECRPLSKRKCFRVMEILKHAPRVDELHEGDALEQVLHRKKTGADAKANEAKESKEEKEARSPDKQ